MGLASFASITRVFGGIVSGDAERQELFKEALFLTLSRATSSDVNISPVEIETVQEIMQTVVGEEVSEPDVRIAAASELYEKATLDDYLSVVGRKLLPKERSTIVQCLAQVIKSDLRISPIELDFFNWVVNALKASPAEIAGLLEAE